MLGFCVGGPLGAAVGGSVAAAVVSAGAVALAGGTATRSLVWVPGGALPNLGQGHQSTAVFLLSRWVDCCIFACL